MASRLRTGFRRSHRRAGAVTIFRPNKKGALRPVKSLADSIGHTLKKLLK